MIEEHCNAFNLGDVIGICPQVEVHLKLCDDAQFFVCPCMIKEEHKLVIEKEINCLEKLRLSRRDLLSTDSMYYW